MGEDEQEGMMTGHGKEASRYGPTAGEERILILAPWARNAEALSSVLREDGLACRTCSDAEELAAEAARGAGAVLLTAAALSPAAHERIQALLAEQPHWSDLPLVVLLTSGDASPSTPAIAALAARNSVTLLEQPVRTLGLVAALRTALRARRRQYEVQLLHDHLEARVEERTRQVRDLAGALTLAEQSERQRISQVLHDHLQQLLFGTQIQVRLIRARLQDTAAAEAASSLDDIADLIEEAIDATRSLTTELSPPVLQKGNLHQALEWLALRMEELHHLHVELETSGPCLDLSDEVQVLLFQIVRELLFNVVKHAGTDHARVVLGVDDGHYRIDVIDRGAGFDSEAVRTQRKVTGGFGLSHARGRLSLIGGHIDIESAPGEGTHIRVAAPPIVDMRGLGDRSIDSSHPVDPLRRRRPPRNNGPRVQRVLTHLPQHT